MADDEQLHAPLRPDGRRARNALDQRDLAEELTGPELSHRGVPVKDHHPPVRHDEELMARLSLFGKDAVEADLDLVRQLAQSLQLGRTHLGEQRHAAEVLELLVGWHAGSLRRRGRLSSPSSHSVLSCFGIPRNVRIKYRGTTNAP